MLGGLRMVGSKTAVTLVRVGVVWRLMAIIRRRLGLRLIRGVAVLWRLLGIERLLLGGVLTSIGGAMLRRGPSLLLGMRTVIDVQRMAPLRHGLLRVLRMLRRGMALLRCLSPVTGIAVRPRHRLSFFVNPAAFVNPSTTL